MYGGFLREAAVLILVFGPLDYLVTDRPSWYWLIVVVLVSMAVCGVFLWWGIRLEERRRP
jgi:hypothetical protein